MQIKIRPVAPADLDALVSMRAAAGLPVTEADSSALVPAGQVHEDAIVLDRGGRISGFATWAPTAERWIGRVLALYLMPEARGQGLDGSLSRALVEALPRDGYRTVYASGLADPWPAALRAAGFRAEGDELRLATAPLLFAGAFAAAIDAEEFDLARRFLDPACAYEVDGRELYGPGAILDRYRASAEAARARLDERINDSRVESLGGDRFRVRFTSRVRAAGHAHTYTTDQILTVPFGEGITRVQQRDRPGERERLVAFFRRAGV